MRPTLLALTLGLVSSLAWAAPPSPEVAEQQRAQMEKLRGEIASQLQLQAYDLLDELVYGWTQQPVFELETPWCSPTSPYRWVSAVASPPSSRTTLPSWW